MQPYPACELSPSEKSPFAMPSATTGSATPGPGRITPLRGAASGRIERTHPVAPANVTTTNSAIRNRIRPSGALYLRGAGTLPSWPYDVNHCSLAQCIARFTENREGERGVVPSERPVALQHRHVPDDAQE